VGYNTQNHRDSEFYMSYGILNIKKWSPSESGSVSVLRRSQGDTLLGPSDRANLSYCTTHSYHYMMWVAQ
jgi:hypothetical protein